MRRGARRALGALLLGPALAVGLGAGCVSQGELNQAIADDLRMTGRVMGFALDGNVEALTTRLGILRAFEDDPRHPRLVEQLGTIAEAEAKLERVQEQRRSLVEEMQRLRQRYDP